MGTLRSFVLGVAKTAAVIVVVIFVLAVLGWGVYQFRQARQAGRETSLATPKKWEVLKIKALDGVELRLSSRWREGSMYYQFSAESYPPALAAVRDAKGARSSIKEPAWTLLFLDDEGFKVFDLEVDLSSMSMTVDSMGNGTGLSTNDRALVSADVYRRASSWQVGWDFPRPKAAASVSRPGVAAGAGVQGSGSRPNWRDKSSWRRLKLGMSKQGVRALLGEPESITEFGSVKVWYYGFARTGEVSFDANDNVSSWSEP